MATEPKTFAPDEFLASLERGELSQQRTTEASIILRGMAKADEGDPNALQFAPGTRCEGWVKVPLSNIDKVAVLDSVPCKDHSHPLVDLHLKPAETPEGLLFSSLLRASEPRGIKLPLTGTPPRWVIRRGPSGRTPVIRQEPYCDTVPHYEIFEFPGEEPFIGCLAWCDNDVQAAWYAKC